MAALTYVGAGDTTNFTSVTSVTVPHAAGSTSGDLVLVFFAFQSVGAGTGPWVVSTSGEAGWRHEVYQAPSATGSGLQVWSANLNFGSSTGFLFDTSRSGLCQSFSYRCPAGTFRTCEGSSGNGCPQVLVAATAQWTGSDQDAPSIVTPLDDTTVVICAAMALTGTGFGWPTGYNERMDNAYLGTFGNTEAGLSDKNQATAGSTGTLALTFPASPSDAKGAGATLGIRCVPGGGTSAGRAGIYRRF